ncbi:MAG: hypothetical protein A2511_07520 [Deltaproteobacteria bacterium RIFOXYD12_FULL_50_9]|nr:MAG: hypothetical protein A2511_07520 [Deltaproteobacteria bacterium RIFOXYD12_FULL_50_9]
MADLSRKKKPFIRLELGFGGLLGLGVVLFCVFFWMFLLGIWAGQTILQPDGVNAKTLNPQKMITSWLSGARQAVTGTLKLKPQPSDADNGLVVLPKAPVQTLTAPPSTIPEPAVAPEKEKVSGPLIFTLQVASYKDEREARDAVLAWRASGQESYLGMPDLEAGDGSWRVLIGKYTRLSDANAAAGKFEEQENTRAFIAQLPESKILTP